MSVELTRRFLDTLLAESRKDDPNVRTILMSMIALLTVLVEHTASDASRAILSEFMAKPGLEELRRRVPDDVALLLHDIAYGMHDAERAPEVASNFESMPCQLLTRARASLDHHSTS